MAIKHIEKIMEMRSKNMTYESIGKELGISRQQVWNIAKMGGFAGTNSKVGKVIYKEIQKWLGKHKMSLHDFCIKCGEDFGSGSRTWRFLTGNHKGDIIMIKNILNVCGLTFEEAFGEVINEGKEKD